MLKNEKAIKQQLDKLYQMQVSAYADNDNKKKIIQGAIQGLEWILGLGNINI